MPTGILYTGPPRTDLFLPWSACAALAQSVSDYTDKNTQMSIDMVSSTSWKFSLSASNVTPRLTLRGFGFETSRSLLSFSGEPSFIVRDLSVDRVRFFVTPSAGLDESSELTLSRDDSVCGFRMLGMLEKKSRPLLSTAEPSLRPRTTSAATHQRLVLSYSRRRGYIPGWWKT